MSQVNPYSMSPSLPAPPIGQRVSINPFNLISRGWELIKADYWLFFGLCLVALFLSGMVPFYIIFGPMFVGLWLCHKELEVTKRTSFETLFRGFDSFMPSLLACLIHMAFMAIVAVPLFIVLAIGMFAVSVPVQGGSEPDPAVVLSVLAVFFVILLPVMMLFVLMQYAMMLSFFLIADRGLQAWESVTVAYGAVLRNFWGMLWLSIVVAFVSILLMAMCVVPAILFIPVQYATMYLLFRELFPVQGTTAAS